MTPGTMGEGKGRGRGVHALLSTFCLAKRKKGNKGKKQTVSKEKQLKDYLSPWSKCWRFSHSRASRILKVFLASQPWWPTILFSVPWPLQFETHFSCTVFNSILTSLYLLKTSENLKVGLSSSKKSIFTSMIALPK